MNRMSLLILLRLNVCLNLSFTVGGNANITEANTPGTIPIPKNATAGINTRILALFASSLVMV